MPTLQINDARAICSSQRSWNGGRFSTLATKRASNAVTRTFTYGYKTNTALVESLSINGGHAFSVTRGYHTDLDLLTSVETKWSTTSRARFDYTYNALYQRETAKQSGDAFADYGDSTFNRYTYNARGELTAAPAYLGSTVTDTSKPLPGRQHEFGYDSIGNRKWTNRTGNAALKESYFGNDPGTEEGANALNQYKRKENDSLPVQGTVDAASTPVAVTGSIIEPGRQGRYWAAEATVANGSGPWSGTLAIHAAKVGGGSGGLDLVRSEPRNAWIAAALQSFSYDLDGNLASDGIWDYQWDADGARQRADGQSNRIARRVRRAGARWAASPKQNSLVRMATTTVAISAGLPNKVMEFRYDYLGRRVMKRDANVSTSERRYLYDGWNLVAELSLVSGQWSVVRSFTWGLDLVGSLTASGGVGALIQIRDETQNKTLLPTYDGNGNVVSLLNADTGGLEAAYEYDPSGQLLRAEGAYAKDNPFRFSTKFQDDETGLIYYGHRYYSAAMGRFLNRDPIEEAGGINLYGFCGNDGVNHWDYLGQSWLSKAFKKLGRWLKEHKRIILSVVAIVASIYIGVNFANAVYQANAATVAAATPAQIAAGQLGTMTVTAHAGALGSAVASGSISAATASTLAGMAGGVAGGFVAGGISTGSLKGALQGAAAGAIMGGIGGYYGGSWAKPLQRIAVTATGGGFAAEVSGGRFRDGLIIAGTQSAMAWGWEQMRQFTDENARRAALTRPDLAHELLSVDHAGALQTAGTIPVRTEEWGARWLNRVSAPIDWIYEKVSMKRQGSGLNWFERIGRDGPINRFVQSVSKVHDWMNSWGYDRSAGLYISRGHFYDSLFSTYSWAAMPPAAVYNAAALAPTAPLIFAAQRGDGAP